VVSPVYGGIGVISVRSNSAQTMVNGVTLITLVLVVHVAVSVTLQSLYVPSVRPEPDPSESKFMMFVPTIASSVTELHPQE
jgi:hypothetical protein